MRQSICLPLRPLSERWKLDVFFFFCVLSLLHSFTLSLWAFVMLFPYARVISLSLERSSEKLRGEWKHFPTVFHTDGTLCLNGEQNVPVSGPTLTGTGRCIIPLATKSLGKFKGNSAICTTAAPQVNYLHVYLFKFFYVVHSQPSLTHALKQIQRFRTYAAFQITQAFNLTSQGHSALFWKDQLK